MTDQLMTDAGVAPAGGDAARAYLELDGIKIGRAHV